MSQSVIFPHLVETYAGPLQIFKMKSFFNNGLRLKDYCKTLILDACGSPEYA